MKRYIVLGVMFAFPLVALAQGNPIENIFKNVKDVVDVFVPIAITLALIYFIWGVAQYVWYVDKDDKKKHARDTMIYGAIGLFFIVSIWGIVGLLQNFAGVAPETKIELPQVPRGQ